MSILIPVILYILKAPVFGGAKPVPINYHNLKGREWGMALVAIAGPLTNFLIAFLAFLIGHFAGFLYGRGGELLDFVFSELLFINLGFMLFNLIPIPPLDGSRVLYAISPDLVVYILILLFGEVFSNLIINGMDGILHLFYFIVGKS